MRFQRPVHECTYASRSSAATSSIHSGDVFRGALGDRNRFCSTSGGATDTSSDAVAAAITPAAACLSRVEHNVIGLGERQETRDERDFDKLHGDGVAFGR